MRPAPCYVCAAPATVNDQRQHPVTSISLTGKVRREATWTGRYLCAAHEHVDPWELP